MAPLAGQTRTSSVAAFVSLLAVICPGAGVQAHSFFVAPIPPTGYYAWDVSDDGTVVVGQAESGRAYRWVVGSPGYVELGTLPGDPNSEAFGVSGDGSVVVGTSGSCCGGQAFRWTAGTGMVGLGDLPGDIFASGASKVSSDGSTIVGAGSGTSGQEAFRWTQSTGMVGLGDLPGGEFASFAADVSFDGSVVVGSSRSGSGGEAFRWTAGTGMVGLSALPGGAFFSSEAAALSADGSTIVGESTSGLGSIKEAFRWTSGTGMVGLGGLPVTTSSPFSRAFGVSGDGSIVVGISGDDDDGITAFIWDESHGMRKLKDVVRTELFLDYPLTAAYAISADGTTIVGQGGGGQAWLLHIPEPASLPLLAGALGSLLALRRRAAASPS